MSAEPLADATAEADVTGIDLAATLRFVSLLAGDPSCRLRAGELARATHTPEGPGSLRVRWGRQVASVEVTERATVQAWGPGAEWLVARVGGFLGCEDPADEFDPDHPVVRAVWARNPGRRVHRTGTIWHDLAWLVLQQRVRFVDAATAWRTMVTDLGEPAPGPLDLLLPPDHRTIAALSYHELHRFGVERSRAETLIRCARAMPRIEGLVDRPFAEVEPRLRAIRGVGPWTAAGLESLTWGCADAVIVGDVKLPRLVCWFLAREELGDDDRMLELLEPFRPHRQRVLRLALTAGVSAPRRAPRARQIDIRRR